MSEEKLMHVNRWGIFEVQIKGTAEGNPFIEQNFTGIFTSKEESVAVNGFYDGEGIYKIRFMPSYEGKYSFVLRATFTDQVFSGAFYVDQAGENNHGPVHVDHTYHFAYADGTPYVSIGTTSYVWHLQDEETKENTLNTLKNSPFNKMRFCVFPKHYVFNFKDPAYFPYVGTPMDASVLTEENFMDYTGKSEGNQFDKKQFNPEYFRNIEEQIQKLSDMGIEADIILFHPYDRWGFSTMSREEDELYLRYVINRFSAYRNVWWAVANEWDLFKEKDADDFDYLGRVIEENDVYHHPRSIHNCIQLYDHSKEWITHVSYQRVDLYKTVEVTDELREKYNKPVVVDELGYEGDIQFGWGNLTAEEEVRRFYETALRGGYPGHGETYVSQDDILWWSHGGVLKGESYKRFSFLKQIISEVKGKQLAPLNNEWDSTCAIAEVEKNEEVKSQYLFYYGFQRPSFRDFYIDETTDYKVEVIDTWDMTIRFAGVFHGKFRIALPSKQYILVRLTKATEMDLIREVDTESKSVKLMGKHPFVEDFEEEINDTFEDKKEVSDDYSDHEEYLQAAEVKEVSNLASPFVDVEDLLDEENEDVDTNEIEDNETVKEVVEETKVEDQEVTLPPLKLEDLDLPEYNESTDDELPIIVTGAIPVVEEDEEEEEEERPLDIPIFKHK